MSNCVWPHLSVDIMVNVKYGILIDTMIKQEHHD